MSNQYFNLYYSPAAQGFDSSTWRTLFGAPLVASNKLVLNDAGIIHYGQILRGDAYFGINTAAPAPGADSKFGFYFPGKEAYAYFEISGANFTAKCSDGVTSNSVAITWQTGWTDTNTEFRIKWEAGTATFFVAGVQQAVIQDISVAGSPMSLYMSNNSNASLFLNYIEVKTIQSYILSEGNENSSFELLAYESEQITVSDVPTVVVPTLFAPASAAGPAFDGITVSENVAIHRAFNVTVSDSVTVTDVRTVGAPA